MITMLIVIAALIAIILIAAMIIGTDIVIERTIIIDKPIDQVFTFIKYIRNHDTFSVWAMMDPEMKKEYRGTDGEIGFVYAWDSSKEKNVGAGEQKIIQIIEGKSIEHELRFIRPMENIAGSKFVFEAVSNNQTKVQWGFYSKMKFPMNIMKYMFQNMLAKDLEKGLNNLKTVMEK